MPARRPRITSARIVDVARVAGVSPQTVSNVVNQRGGYSDETQMRVQAAITRVGYRPNRAARQLRTNRTMQLGLILGAEDFLPRNPFTLTFTSAAVDAAHRVGRRIVLYTSGVDPHADMAFWDRSGEVDGFLLCNATIGDARTRALTALGLPFALMGRTSPHEPQTWVDIDNHAAMGQIVDYLVAKGHRDFAYLDYPDRAHWASERLRGTEERLAHHGLALPPGRTLIKSYEELGPSIDQLVTGAHRPTALITASDSLAVLALMRARTHGLTIGHDLAVTGFDGVFDWFVDPALTTIRIPIAAAATAVVTRLMLEIQEGPTGQPGLILPTELSVGESA